MIKKRILYWIIIEESKDATTFEGSLHSKMPKINFDRDFWNMLKCKRSSNNIRWSSAVLKEEVRKKFISFAENLGDMNYIAELCGDLIR